MFDVAKGLLTTCLDSVQTLKSQVPGVDVSTMTTSPSGVY